MYPRLSCAVILAGSFICACAPSVPAPATAPTAPHAVTTPVSAVADKRDPRGMRIVDALEKRDWAAVEARFAPSLQSTMTAEKLASTWSSMVERLGPFEIVESTRSWMDGEKEQVVAVARFAQGRIDVKASFGAKGSESATDLSFAAGDVSARALKLVTPFVEGSPEAIYAHLDESTKGKLSQEALRDSWKGTIAKLGAWNHFEDVKTQTSAAIEAAGVTAAFDKGRADIILVFHPGTETLAAFVVRPASAAPDPAPPRYADVSAFTEQDAPVGTGRGALPGTLSLPKGTGPFPAVVLVHGSGPNDRDETVAAQRPFRDLAWGLASHGIAVLRYEKRTYGSNAASLVSIAAKVTVDDEIVNDAVEATKLLAHAQGVDSKRIYVLGHSQGGMMAPRIAEHSPAVAGLILLSPPARPIEDVFLEQVTRRAANGDSATRAALEDLKKKVTLAKSEGLTTSTPASELPLGKPASYWLALRGYDPVTSAKKVGKPTLVLWGTSDDQVSREDFELWKRGLSRSHVATVTELAGLNHLLIDGPSNFETPAHVDERAVTQIIEWISRPAFNHGELKASH